MNEISDFEKDSLWDKCTQSIAAGNGLEAVLILKELASKGFWPALAQLGVCYEGGCGNLKKNITEANRWYRKSIFECDDPFAHIGIGRSYYNGHGGIQQNFKNAFFHFMKAYKKNMPESGIYLGIMTYHGLATVADTKKAREYFLYSAEQGYFIGYIHIARLDFFSGHIINAIKSLVKAKSLYLDLKKQNKNDPRLLGMNDKKL